MAQLLDMYTFKKKRRTEMKQILHDFLYWLVHECTISRPFSYFEKTIAEYLEYLKMKEE